MSYPHQNMRGPNGEIVTIYRPIPVTQSSNGMLSLKAPIPIEPGDVVYAEHGELKAIARSGNVIWAYDQSASS
jgi:hypothetical protein